MAATIKDKEITKIHTLTRDTLKTDVHVNILAVHKVFVLERLKKNKENYLDRFLVIVHEPGRVLLVKSGLVGKSIQENILIITINELKHFVHNTEYFCIELLYNERSKSLVLCTKDNAACHQILIHMLSSVHMVSQCLSFAPALTDIPRPEVLDKIDKSDQFLLDPPAILAQAYQILCILEDVAIDRNLYELFTDDNFHFTNHIFDINYILRHYTVLAMKQGTNKYKVNAQEVMVILHALQSVDSFSHIHLDGIRMTHEIVQRLAKLMVRNVTIQSIALRKTCITAPLFYILNKTLDEEITRNTRLSKKMKILDHLTLSHNDLQLCARKKETDSSFFESMDGNVLCVRKLYLSRCNLNRDLLCSVIDSGINYAYLSKIDLSYNDLSEDSMITLKLSQFCRKIVCLEALLLAECKLKLTFLQDIVHTDNRYKFDKHLMFLDLSGNVMTHYGAQAIGQILQNTVTDLTIDVSAVHGMDSAMLETILCGPFRSAFKNIHISLALRRLNLNEKECLSALEAQIQYAQKQKSDTNGIQEIDLSHNHLCAAPFTAFCTSYIANFYCLESLTLDANFKYKNKKGIYAKDMECLCAALSSLDKLTTLSLCGEVANNLYMTFEDLSPLLQYIGTAKCKLTHLLLDGNRIKDDGCKAIAHSISINPQSKLKIISIEDNKCSFKGFKAILDAIDTAASAKGGGIQLCDIPIHSILDDSSFKNKVKKHKDKIEKVIAILNDNRLSDEQQQAHEAQEKIQLHQQMSGGLGLGVPTNSGSNAPRVSIAPSLVDDESERKERVSPGLHYSKATHKNIGGHANVDKLAMLLNTSSVPKLKSIKGKKKRSKNKQDLDDEKGRPQSEIKSISVSLKHASNKEKEKQNKVDAETKIVSLGIDAQLRKSTSVAPKKNPKSKRRKKTRKKIVV